MKKIIGILTLLPCLMLSACDGSNNSDSTVSKKTEIPEYVSNAEGLLTNAYDQQLKFEEKNEAGNWFIGAAPSNQPDLIDVYMVWPIGGDMGFSIYSVNGSATTEISRFDQKYAKYFAEAPFEIIKDVNVSDLVDYFSNKK